MKKHKKLIIKCNYCNQDFERHYFIVKQSKHNFCSRNCYDKWKKITENNSFFNHNKYNITKKFLIKEYLINKKSLQIIAKILDCSKDNIRHWILKFNITLRKRNETKNKIFKNSGNPNYIDGRNLKPYPTEFNSKLKLEIRKRDNYNCQGEYCKMTEEEHLAVYGRILEVHHIDYNKQNCNENNLITLCKQCNIRANYSREYWQKYFQKKLQGWK